MSAPPSLTGRVRAAYQRGGIHAARAFLAFFRWAVFRETGQPIGGPIPDTPREARAEADRLSRVAVEQGGPELLRSALHLAEEADAEGGA